MSTDKPRVIEWDIFEQRLPIALPRGDYAANLVPLATVVASSASEAIAIGKARRISHAPVVAVHRGV